MKHITYSRSFFGDSTLGAWLYTYYVTFPGDRTYQFTATEEGFWTNQLIWKEAGYTWECTEEKDHTK